MEGTVQCSAAQCSAWCVCVCMGHVCEDGDGDRRGVVVVEV